MSDKAQVKKDGKKKAVTKRKTPVERVTVSAETVRRLVSKLETLDK